ncbi:MAG: SPFH domain-containing protein [Patescibacteria group bacterium]|nr:SPFH domain-containing protein [Patescibacteria group bacterium]
MNWEFLKNLVPQSPSSPEEDLPEGPLWIGWVVFLSILFLGLILAFFGKGPQALIFISLAFLYFLIALYIVREPEVAILFLFGRAIRKLKKGWWLTFWPFHSIEHETTARQRLHDNEENEKQKLYYIDGDRKIAIEVFMRVFFRLTVPYHALRSYGGLNTPESRADIESTTFASLRAELGKRTFKQLLESEDDVAQEVQRKTNEKLKKPVLVEIAPGEPMEFHSGYEVVGIDVYDYNEMVQSEASRIRELADAKAHEAGSVAQAVSEPLRGNMPAAIAQSVSTVATTLRDINRERLETRRQERKEAESTAAPSEAESFLGKLQELLERK